MRDLRLLWPRWMGFITALAIAAALLLNLRPDTTSLTVPVYERLLGELSSNLGEDPYGVQVDGGAACERAAKDIFGDRSGRREGRQIQIRCALEDGAAVVEVRGAGSPATGSDVERRTMTMPGGLSLLPPLVAILFAFFFRKIGLALFAGIMLSGLMVENFDVLAGLKRASVDYLFATATDPLNLYVYAFTVALIGMVNVSIAMGGMQGIVLVLGRWAQGARSTQLATALMGLAVFFDDYANSVVVGGSARPLTDAARVSREKLAYIVDSTAAPIAGLAVVSTWIGVEAMTFHEALEVMGPREGIATSGYAFFLQALPYRFYCLFAIALVFLVGALGRDFGPMLRAERMARLGRGGAPDLAAPQEQGSSVEPREGVAPRWFNGVIPVAVTLAVTLFGSIAVGMDALSEAGRDVAWFSLTDLGDAFVEASSGDTTFAMLWWGAFAGSVSAFALAIGQRLLTWRESVSAWSRGVLAMLPAVGILVLAMSIRGGVDDLMAAQVVISLLGDVSPMVLPLFIFLISGGIAFATGTSFATMLLVVPVALPLAAGLTDGHPDQTLLLIMVGASVLDGAIFGDHCSPISDTTVMSSVSSGCELVAHVRTQIPYALLAMFVAAMVGYLLVAWSGGTLFWLTYPLGGMMLFVALRWVGESPES